MIIPLRIIIIFAENNLIFGKIYVSIYLSFHQCINILMYELLLATSSFPPLAVILLFIALLFPRLLLQLVMHFH